METTKNNMSPFASDFFKKLSNYLDTKIYFYGSIQRIDYFPMSSDIDCDIFTDNEYTTLSQLQTFLGVKRYEFKKFVYRLHKTKTMVNGYKIKYSDEKNNFSTEISIYNYKYKDLVLTEHNSKTDLPIYVSVLLVCLKTIYYNYNFISKPIYKFFKTIIMNFMVEGEDVEFITTEIPKHKDEI
uniref:Polymerase nucleotidyl transferase domain-containing protein n=1 Tax=viral metagenome TaxID=1070528 RepID=A0A6C0EPI2_9ZZZZ